MTELNRRWRHSFEEDHDGIQVYRPESFDFPPARGRGGVEFGPDGKFVEWSPGRADVPESQPGTWTPGAEPEALDVTVGGRRRVVHLVSIDTDKLELLIGDQT